MERVSSIDGTSAGREVFALTDEQILGMEPEAGVASGEWRAASDAAVTDEQLLEDAGTSTERGAASTRDGERSVSADNHRANSGGETQDPGNEPRSLHYGPHEARPSGRDDNNSKDSRAEAGVSVPQAPPQWLAERMRDPWHGDEAKELWEGAVQARQEAAAYREAIATPAEARALKELYPGGVNEAKSAAERARQLEEFDAAYFGTAGKPAEALSAARVQLAQRLMEQDPPAFREMVALGVRLLERQGGKEVASGQAEKSRSLAGARDDKAQVDGEVGAREGLTPEGVSYRDGKGGQPVAPQVPPAYVSFEKATNADLEKSVGGAIARAMEQALPNLKSLDRAGSGAAQGTPLQERLGAAVREEVEAALKSDAHLGEQVARILGARRFDDATRAQVVRVIDARAQQLVPGAVKRVVGSWTTATLGTTGKSRAAETANGDSRTGREGAVRPAAQNGKNGQSAGRRESAEQRPAAPAANRRRVDYRKLSDEQILDMS